MTSLEISFVAELNFLSQIKFLFPHCSPLNSFMPTLLYSRYPISGIFLYLISCAENNTYTLNNLFFSLFFFSVHPLVPQSKIHYPVLLLFIIITSYINISSPKLPHKFLFNLGQFFQVEPDLQLFWYRHLTSVRLVRLRLVDISSCSFYSGRYPHLHHLHKSTVISHSFSTFCKLGLIQLIYTYKYFCDTAYV